MFFHFVIIVAISVVVDGSSSRSNTSRHKNVNYISDPKGANIDFSQAKPGPDGLVCIDRMKYIDKTETDQLKECFVQNVTQCYYTYITEYSDGEEEKCDEFFWKQCKIVFEERTFNATSRTCKRPLIKKCDPKFAAEGKMVCETFFETSCNTTDVIPEPGDEPLAVTFCHKTPRKICAPDNCRIEEDFERCTEKTVQSITEYPTELCDLQPQKHCRRIKVAVPRLTPEKHCRQTEKQICNTQLVNPHTVDKAVFIKYCTRKEKVHRGGYLPPPPPKYSAKPSNNVGLRYPPKPPPVYIKPTAAPVAPTTSYGLPRAPAYSTSHPQPQPVYPHHHHNNAVRNKREESLEEDRQKEAEIVVKTPPISPPRKLKRNEDEWDRVDNIPEESDDSLNALQKRSGIESSEVKMENSGWIPIF